MFSPARTPALPAHSKPSSPTSPTNLPRKDIQAGMSEAKEALKYSASNAIFHLYEANPAVAGWLKIRWRAENTSVRVHNRALADVKGGQLEFYSNSKDWATAPPQTEQARSRLPRASRQRLCTSRMGTCTTSR